MAHNRATIYSNGIADFQRVYEVTKNAPQEISLPVRQQHLGDVLASLTVAGDVKIESPPSYQPANQDDTNIRIDTGNAIVSLAHQLSGSNVSLKVAGSEDTHSGKLVGMHSQQVATDAKPITENYLVVLSESGIQRISIREIQSLEFSDPVIQSEINKALSHSLRQIKPNSTFVDLTLSTQEDSAEAILQYTIPAAAWKISYRLILEEDQPIGFHGHAIVDNNTDEDWKDFIISVVMGQPITFTTDLADSKMPVRSHVNIVQESALGAVEVEEAMEEVNMDFMAVAGGAAPMAAADAREQQRGRSKRSRRSFAPAAVAMAQSAKKIARDGAASIDEAEISETGDFCIFESSTPVSIDARRSAVIPVFQTDLFDSTAVLHYRFANHAERPFQSIRFQNTTEHSLGRGVCTVYNQTTYAGTCILPATKPGADALLPHALETLVKVRRKSKPMKNRRVGIRIADGFGYESHHQMAETEYLINGSRDRTMPFILDHDWQLQKGNNLIQIVRNGTEVETIESKELKKASRIEFDLQPNETLAINVIETNVTKSKINLIGRQPEDNAFRIDWLTQNVIETDHSMANDPVVTKCLEIRRLLDEKQDQINHAMSEVERLSTRQERLRKNIKSGGADRQTEKWREDLAKAEDAIVQLEEEFIPKLRDDQKELRAQLFDAIKGLVIEINEG